MRPLIVGAGVISGMLVLLFANIEDMAAEVSMESVDEVDANAVLDEVVPVEFVTASEMR